MNKFLIGLRNYNLRTIVVIVFVLSIAVGFLNTLGGKSIALSMIATAILSTFLYLVFTTQAIENDEKALMCAKFELIAFLTLLVGFAFIYKKIAELNIESEYFIYRYSDYFMTVAPMSFVSNLLYAFAFAYGVKSVIPKFRLIWFLYLFIIILNVINSYSVFLIDRRAVDFAERVSVCITILSFVAYIILFVVGKKEFK